MPVVIVSHLKISALVAVVANGGSVGCAKRKLFRKVELGPVVSRLSMGELEEIKLQNGVNLIYEGTRKKKVLYIADEYIRY